MNAPFSAALAKRLAAYSATAGLTLAAAPDADAQVVYHDFDPDLTLEAHLPPATLDLDLDDDGAPDLQLFACGGYDGYVCPETSSSTYAGTRRRVDGRYGPDYVFAVRAARGNGVLGHRAGPPWRGCASRLSTGDAVGPAGPGLGFYRYGAVASYTIFSAGYGCYNFNGLGGYAGFRFVAADGALHYGWLRLSSNFNASDGTAYEYAYESAPETPILAGAFSDVVLTGAVDKTAFPPSGGTLRYTFTAENITNAPLPLDLWVHYRRGANPGRTRRLGSGTLPPRARVTRTVALPVPAGAPAGTYDVRFKVGDFAARRFLTFQRFEVTKQAASLGEEASDLLTVEPVEGDLFAEGEGTTGIAGTHVLSAPTPNPSSGQAALTLTVAEAQAVRVEVLDALGRRVALLHDGPLAAGAAHRLVFDGSGLPSGVYVVRAVGEAFSDTRVLTLTR